MKVVFTSTSTHAHTCVCLKSLWGNEQCDHEACFLWALNNLTLKVKLIMGHFYLLKGQNIYIIKFEK